MSNNNRVFVFCIGGTGLRVMKSITMLLAAGMRTNGFTVVPIIMDPHLELDEKKNLKTLLREYEAIHQSIIANNADTPTEFFNAEVKTLSALDATYNDTDEAVGEKRAFTEFINFSKIKDDDVNKYLVQSIFSEKNLKKELSLGFKGNPNVGTVVLGDIIEGADWFKSFTNIFQKGDRIFIISSIFGGTGASGYPLIEKKVRESESDALKNGLMGAVTVLPYYNLKKTKSTESDIDSASFITKTKAALAYYEKTVQSDYLYYAGETKMLKEYENDENKQDDKAHFIELVAASALFDFLEKNADHPKDRQYLTRSIDEDDKSLDCKKLGVGYNDLVKHIADLTLLKQLLDILPKEKWFPLKKTRNFNENFYNDKDFKNVKGFVEKFMHWYNELSSNNRSFSPLRNDKDLNVKDWVKEMQLSDKEADDSNLLLEMIKSSNQVKAEKHHNSIHYFLEFAYNAIDSYTQRITK